MKPLDDKTSEPVALITGVSSGIGHAAARVLIDAGWEVWGTVRNESDAQRLRETFGSRFQPLLFDVRSDSGQHADLARHIQSLLGGRLLS
ncbi:MAG: SDR family NAD(P)-dependent oxidoreductase, partial [Saprospiraceae bacterium]|nr:SDR family NAD(P)-dependent oxidoreductase [Saprospiraceae bacterium]